MKIILWDWDREENGFFIDTIDICLRITTSPCPIYREELLEFLDGQETISGMIKKMLNEGKKYDRKLSISEIQEINESQINNLVDEIKKFTDTRLQIQEKLKSLGFRV